MQCMAKLSCSKQPRDANILLYQIETWRQKIFLNVRNRQVETKFQISALKKNCNKIAESPNRYHIHSNRIRPQIEANL